MRPSTYGIKISQVGVNVRFAADWQLVFNSDWPSVVIVFDQNITVGTGTIFGTPVLHNLSFTPFAMCWMLDGGGNAISRIPVNITAKAIYIPNVSSETTFNIKAYAIDLTVSANYQLPAFPPTTKTLYDPTYGIKVVKYGHGINSSDLRNFILNSQAQSPAVLSVITQDTPKAFDGNTLTYKNPKNYIPWQFGFSRTTNSTPTSNLDPSTTLYIEQPPEFLLTDLNQLQLSGIPDGGTFIVLRDPLVAPAKIRTVYNG